MYFSQLWGGDLGFGKSGIYLAVITSTRLQCNVAYLSGSCFVVKSCLTCTDAQPHCAMRLSIFHFKGPSGETALMTEEPCQIPFCYLLSNWPDLFVASFSLWKKINFHP